MKTSALTSRFTQPKDAPTPSTSSNSTTASTGSLPPISQAHPVNRFGRLKAALRSSTSRSPQSKMSLGSRVLFRRRRRSSSTAEVGASEHLTTPAPEKEAATQAPAPSAPTRTSASRTATGQAHIGAQTGSVGPQRTSQATPADASAAEPPSTGKDTPGPRKRSTSQLARKLIMGSAASLMVWVLFLWISADGLSQMSTPGGFSYSLGRILALEASVLLLIQVTLMARIPAIESTFGQPELTRFHRTVGYASFTMMIGHVLLITVGLGMFLRIGFVGAFMTFMLTYPGGLLAVVGVILLCLVVATSIAAARTKMNHETWHLIHLYAYLGAGIAVPHQLWVGTSFRQDPLATLFWWGAWIGTAIAVISYRIVMPLVRSRNAHLRVTNVEAYSDDITRITMSGSNLARWNAQPGQYFVWRFLDTPEGWTPHPFSLSAAPAGDELQIMVKHVGDGTSTMGSIPVGCKVAVEGPYGALRLAKSHSDKVLLVANGIGATPIRAMLDGLPADVDAEVIYRCREASSDPLAADLATLARERGAHFVVLQGRRSTLRSSWLPDAASGLTDAEALRRLVPDVAERDVFICGVKQWALSLHDAAHECGVPKSQIHVEHFDG